MDSIPVVGLIEKVPKARPNAVGHGSLVADSGDEDDDSAAPQIRALPDGAKSLRAKQPRATSRR